VAYLGRRQSQNWKMHQNAPTHLLNFIYFRC